MTSKKGVSAIKKNPKRPETFIGIVAGVLLLMGAVWAVVGGEDPPRTIAAENGNNEQEQASVKADSQSRWPFSLFNDDKSKVAVVIPRHGFHHEQLNTLVSSLKKRGIKFVTTSNEIGVAKPFSKYAAPVKIDQKLAGLNPNDFDAFFLIDGKNEEFCVGKCKSVINSANQSGIPVVAFGKAEHTASAIGTFHKTQKKKEQGIYVRTPKDGKGKIMVGNNVETTVHLIFDKS